MKKWLQNIIVFACYKKEMAHARDGVKEAVKRVKGSICQDFWYAISRSLISARWRMLILTVRKRVVW